MAPQGTNVTQCGQVMADVGLSKLWGPSTAGRL